MLTSWDLDCHDFATHSELQACTGCPRSGSCLACCGSRYSTAIAEQQSLFNLFFLLNENTDHLHHAKPSGNPLTHTALRNPFSPRLLLQRRIAQASAERSNHDSTGRSSSRGFTGAKIVAQVNISVSDFDLVVCGSGMSFRPPHPALHVLSWQAQRLPW